MISKEKLCWTPHQFNDIHQPRSGKKEEGQSYSQLTQEGVGVAEKPGFDPSATLLSGGGVSEQQELVL